MLDAVIWFIVIEIIGLASFPFCYYLFPFLKDRGYCISKPIGILILGYFVWLLSVLNLLPSIQPTIIGLAIVFIGLSFFIIYKKRMELKLFITENVKLLIVTEAIFIFFLLFWVIYKTYDPSINHTEQPMDFGFFNASIKSVYGHPQDPWLSGNSIDYYYFGYWIFGIISILSNVSLNISYNLSVATVAALVSSSVFGLVSMLIKENNGSQRESIIVSVATIFFILFSSNLHVLWETLTFFGILSKNFLTWLSIDGLSKDIFGDWYLSGGWWRSTRIINFFENGQGIDYTISEFPLFSFILGDLHPHLMSIPFLILSAI